MFELGHTKVWVTCRGPRESSTTCGVTVDVSFAAFSSLERRKHHRTDRRARELAQLLERAFGQIVETRTFPRSRVDLQVKIIQADGGLPWACFNACSLALMDGGVPMRDLCVACGVGFVDNFVLVDPNASESANFNGVTLGGELWMAVAPREMKVVSCNFAGKVSEGSFEVLSLAAEESCKQIFNAISAFVATFYKSVKEEDEEAWADGD